MSKSATQRTDVVELLTGRDCRYCDVGTLTVDEYKGDRAAVCDDCGTPAVRLW